MERPNIGDLVTTDRAKGLCGHYGYGHLVTRIDTTPDAFKPWIFDGASMIPDKIVAELSRIPHLTEIALKHDLKYAYGEPGDKAEREKADQDFRKDLLDDGAAEAVAELMYQAVRLFGDPPRALRTSFSWGFARK